MEKIDSLYEILDELTLKGMRSKALQKVFCGIFDASPEEGTSLAVFFDAVASGDVETAKNHARRFANEKGPNGDAAIHVACENADALMLSLLLESGADVESRDSSHRTPFLRLCAGETLRMIPPFRKVPSDGENEKFSACLDILRKAGADLETFGDDGCDALHILARRINRRPTNATNGSKESRRSFSATCTWSLIRRR